MHNLYTSNYTIPPRFWIDSSTQDYKVIRVMQLLDHEEIAIEVKVFSLRVGVKRLAKKPLLDTVIAIVNRRCISQSPRPTLFFVFVALGSALSSPVLDL
ncbi:unnamed protein product [Linum trigynum]|uniref:Uncharacterized protein n=1 Tax=Linum trigynum TaxID=586398 RepID=A0AAV2E0A9_9ROSI